MAYINAEEVRAIRIALKAEYPDFKFSVKKGYNGSSVDVTVVEGPTDFSDITDRGYAQINQYHTHMYGRHQKFFDNIVKIIKTAPALAGGKVWFDESDAMTDYFHIAYYFHINVGAWNQPYQLKEYA